MTTFMPTFEFQMVTDTYDNESLMCGDAVDSKESYSFTSILTFIILVIINMTILIGNGLVIAAVYMNERMQTVTNFFIVSLAFSDLIVGLAVLPFSAIWEVFKVSLFGEFWCEIWLTMNVWMCTVSILNLCGISLDRYVAVTHPMSYHSIMTPTRAKLLIAGVWILSFIICFPPLVGWIDARLSVAPERQHANIKVVELVTTALPINSSSTNYTDFSDVMGLAANVTGNLIRNFTSNSSESQPDGDNENGQDAWDIAQTAQEYIQMMAGEDITQSPNETPFAGSTVVPPTEAPVYKYQCPNTCKHTNDIGYVVYSALGSFFIPFTFIIFFYWRIYVAAVDTCDAIKQGYRTTKGIGGKNETVTLRIHRGRGLPKKKNGSFKRKGRRSPEITNSGCKKQRGGQPTKKTSASPATKQKLPQLPKKPTSPVQTTSFIEEPIPGTSDGRTHLVTNIAVTESEPSPDNTNQQKTSPPPKPRLPAPLGTGREVVCKVRYTVENEKTKQEPTCTIEILEPDQGQTDNEDSHTVEATETTDTDTPRRRKSQKPKRKFRFAKFLRKINTKKIRLPAIKFRRETKAARTLGVILGGFAFCWTPFFAIYVYRSFCFECVNSVLFSIFFWLGYCNSAINPFIYALFSLDFRKAFRKIIYTFFGIKRPQDRLNMKSRRRENRYRAYFRKFRKRKLKHLRSPTTTQSTFAAPAGQYVPRSTFDTSPSNTTQDTSPHVVIDIPSSYITTETSPSHVVIDMPSYHTTPESSPTHSILDKRSYHTTPESSPTHGVLDVSSRHTSPGTSSSHTTPDSTSPHLVIQTFPSHAPTDISSPHIVIEMPPLQTSPDTTPPQNTSDSPPARSSPAE